MTESSEDRAPAAAGKSRPERVLGADLRGAIPDASAAIAVSGIVYAVFVIRIRGGVDAAALEMPEMLHNGGAWAYSWSQAVGWAALLWSWLTTLLGVALPLLARRQNPLRQGFLERIHRSTSLTLIGLMVVHALLLSWDKMGDTVLTDFVPWTTSYLPGRFPEALGIVSFYLAVLLGPSFYLRRRLGPRTWRLLHRYFVPAVYVLAVWHTFAYGSDVKARNPIWIVLWAMQVPVAAAFAWRCLGPTFARLRGSR